MSVLWPQPAEFPMLDQSEAHIWSVPILRTTPIISTDSTLTPDEQTRAREYAHEPSRHRFVSTRLALRELLGRYLQVAPSEVALEIPPNGKPQLVGSMNSIGLRFNVAHSGDLALIGISLGHEIGVDIEQRRHVENAAQIASRYFHSQEIAAICSATPSTQSDEFLLAWTAKEAVLKSLGKGISNSLSEFAAAPDKHAAATLIEVPHRENAEPGRCWVRRLELGGQYFGAVAVVGANPEIRRMTFGS